jgi:rhamnosyltransferase
MTYKVSAYITSYEDQHSLEKCIKSIKAQTYLVEKIFIVDNSSDSSKISFPFIDTNVVVEHHPSNIGVSGGLAEGLTWAKNNNYDFLWTFDQDSQARVDCLENLINEYDELINQGHRVGIIGPLPIDSNTEIEVCGRSFNKFRLLCSPNHDQSTYECDVVITSGSLVLVSATKQIDSLNIELFIDAVDWDFCFSLKHKGYKVFLTRRAIIEHKFSDLKVINLFFKKILINNYSPLRHYYICRNHTYFLLRLTSPQYIPLLFTSRILYALRTMLKILFYESNKKLEKIWACYLGTIDGCFGHLGKTWN